MAGYYTMNWGAPCSRMVEGRNGMSNGCGTP